MELELTADSKYDFLCNDKCSNKLQLYVITLLFLSILVIEESDGVLESVDGCDLPGELSDERSLPHNVLCYPE